MVRLIGLDIGTSSVKAVLLDSAGQVFASASAPVALHIPQPGWAEQTPQDWWQAVCQVICNVLEMVGGEDVSAVGLSGQCPGHVLVDQRDQALGNAIIWRDQRAKAEAGWLRETVTPKQASESLGSSSIGSPTEPLARLLWLKNNRPEDWQAASSILQPKDYIALRLTGQSATDRYSAFCLANPDTGRYDTSFFERLCLDPAKLPPLLNPEQTMGLVTPQAESDTGLKAGTRVVVGTIDAYCDTLAGGIACPGRAVDVAGTSENISLRIESPVQVDGIYTGRISDEVLFLCGPTQAGGETLRWMAYNLYGASAAGPDFLSLETEAGSAPAGSEGLVFLPYLDGERTPVWDTHARGVFFGMTFAHQRRHFTRSVYEGVAFAIRHILELGEQATGTPASQVVICGGGSRSAFWNQVKADVLQRDVYPARIAETGCLGAAILAAVGMGLYPDLSSASQTMIRLQEPIQPNPENRAAYEENYQVYRSLYPLLKPLFIENPNAGRGNPLC